MYWKDIGIFASMTAAGVLFISNSNDLKQQHQWALEHESTAAGTIDDPDARDQHLIDTGARNLRVNFMTDDGSEVVKTYKVSNQYYKKHFDHSYLKNANVKVIYDPENPEDSFLEGGERHAGGNIGKILAGIGTCGLFLTVFNTKKK